MVEVFTAPSKVTFEIENTSQGMKAEGRRQAIEQTILQKVVPAERLGRVFGFAHSIEQSASPITAFFIGPVAQWLFVPFMTTGRGVELIGDWFGTGTARGLALVFITAGCLGLIVTALARRSKAYRRLSAQYLGG